MVEFVIQSPRSIEAIGVKVDQAPELLAVMVADLLADKRGNEARIASLERELETSLTRFKLAGDNAKSMDVHHSCQIDEQAAVVHTLKDDYEGLMKKHSALKGRNTVLERGATADAEKIQSLQAELEALRSNPPSQGRNKRRKKRGDT
jgi:hypothetical protein